MPRVRALIELLMAEIPRALERIAPEKLIGGGEARGARRAARIPDY